MLRGVETRYSNGNINESYTVDQHERKIGPYRRWHMNGDRQIEAVYTDGKRDGDYREWYDAGHRKIECGYKKGVLDGRFKKTHRDGDTWLVCNYKDGKATEIVSLVDMRHRDCILPEGPLIVWKACRVEKMFGRPIDVYVKLSVTEGTRRVTPIDGHSVYKSRVESGRVEEIVDAEGKHYNEAESFVRGAKGFKYKVGEIVRVDDFDGDLNHGCGPGINVHPYKDQCDVWFD